MIVNAGLAVRGYVREPVNRRLAGRERLRAKRGTF